MLEDTSKHMKLMIEYIFVQIKDISKYGMNHKHNEIGTKEPRKAKTLRINDGK